MESQIFTLATSSYTYFSPQTLFLHAQANKGSTGNRDISGPSVDFAAAFGGTIGSILIIAMIAFVLILMVLVIISKYKSNQKKHKETNDQGSFISYSYYDAIYSHA